MATGTRSHSRLISIPGTDISVEINQLKSQIFELDKPSEDVHNIQVKELKRKLAATLGDPEDNSTPDAEFHSLSDELRERNKWYKESNAAWAERYDDLTGGVLERLQQFVDTSVAPLGEAKVIIRWNQSHFEAPTDVDNAAIVDGHVDAIVSPNMPPPPTTASSSTNAAASRRQPSGQPTTASTRASGHNESAHRPDWSAQHEQNPSYSQAPRQSQAARNTDRFKTFHQVFKNGNATHKYIIFHYPHTIQSQDGNIYGEFWILRCDACNMHFSSEKGERATQHRALKHIRSLIHCGQAPNQVNILSCFGIVVENCTAEQSRQNNEAVIAAIRSKQYVPETLAKKQWTRAKLETILRAEAPDARRSAHRPNQAARISASGHAFDQHVLDEYQRRTALVMNAEQGEHIGRRTAPQSRKLFDFRVTLPRPPTEPMPVIKADQDHLYDTDLVDFTQES